MKFVHSEVVSVCAHTYLVPAYRARSAHVSAAAEYICHLTLVDVDPQEQLSVSSHRPSLASFINLAYVY